MLLKKHILLIILLLHKVVMAQNPQCFIYNDENGLPSNETYSIVQDNKGFIWIGCDAGLYKYDGIRYIPYKSKKQKAKSITGLTISPSGKLYCYNFQSQVFMLQNDTLVEISNLFPAKITSITSQKNGLIFISHSGGIDIYNEQNKSWAKHGTNDKELAITNNDYVTKNARHNPSETVFFLKTNGVAEYANEKIKLFKTDLFKNQSPGLFIPEYYDRKLWIFSAENNAIYTYYNAKIEQINVPDLLHILSNRKITSVITLPDENLWICTYKGVIKYNANSEKVELYYPEKSFTDCMIDREGNYWFSTLQTGLLRVPNMHMLVWNTDNELLNNDKVSKISYGDEYIYFATVNGTIGKLHAKTHELKTFHTGNHGDVQSFDYDESTKTLLFYMNNNLFSLKDNNIKLRPSGISAIKTIKQIGNDYFIGSSGGLYINNKAIKPRWIRAIEYDTSSHTIWVASNDGLMKIVWQNKEWVVQKTLFEGEQILSISFDEEQKLIYALTFDGKIYSVNQQEKSNYISEIPDKILTVKIKYDNGIIYVATNKGLWKYTIKNNGWETFTRLSGLASDNIQGLVIANQSIWLATGKGVQQIPLTETQNKKSAIVYLKKIIAGKHIVYTPSKLSLKYGESVLLYPETSSYNSNGNYKYAYRIKSTDTSWVRLPSSIEQIEIQNIPSGNFEIELKVIDHHGLDSENTIVLNGTIKPPFWKTIWFALIVTLSIASLAYVLFTMRINKIRQMQRKEIERINLENDLRLSRETALKAQMNPHFIFNVLNSIKAYIYKNDKQKAIEYLNDFSALIRTFLNMSNSNSVSLKDELKMLKLYISMEAMQLNNDFTYQQNIDNGIDLTSTYIPTLIIQPYIENAFKHGLHHKKGNKHLTLNIIDDKENKIVLEIIDNGIGRVASQNRNNTKNTSHQSFATTALEKRIALLNKDKNLVDVAIIDLHDKENPIGTKVIIKIAHNE